MIFFRVLLLHRYIYQRDANESSVPASVAYYYSFKLQTGAFYQGYGRHTKEQVYSIGKADLKTINDLIGDNKFLMAAQVCDADAAVFGSLCQIMHHCRGPLHDFLKSIFLKIIPQNHKYLLLFLKITAQTLYAILKR